MAVVSFVGNFLSLLLCLCFHHVLVFLCQLHTDPDVDVAPREKSTETIEDVPIFRNEEEKLEFEASVTVDLSCVDHMFKVHMHLICFLELKKKPSEF